MDEFADWMTDTVQVETKTGRGSQGDTFAPPQPLAEVMVTRARKLVRNASGDLTTSTLQVMLEPARAGTLTVGSLVTAAGDSRPSAVISVAVDTHELDVAVAFCE